MGAYAYDYVNKAVNNTNYAGTYSKKIVEEAVVASSVSPSVSSVAVEAGGSVVGKAVSVGSRVLSRANLVYGALSTAWDFGQYLQHRLDDDEIAELPEEQQEAVRQSQALSDSVAMQSQKTESLKDETGTIASSVNYEQGQTLPSVLSQNAKALTQSINSLTTSLNEQFALLNNYMMANLMYQQQFLDLKTEVSGLKIESMEFNKTSQMVKDLDGNEVANMSPREAQLAKNTTVAKDTTDKINFDIPEELDSDLSSDDLDISSILGYDDGSDIFKEFYTRMGGTGL